MYLVKVTLYIIQQVIADNAIYRRVFHFVGVDVALQRSALVVGGGRGGPAGRASAALTATNYRNLVEIIWSLLASSGGKCARYGCFDAQWRRLRAGGGTPW